MGADFMKPKDIQNIKTRMLRTQIVMLIHLYQNVLNEKSVKYIFSLVVPDSVDCLLYILFTLYNIYRPVYSIFNGGHSGRAL